MVGFLLGMLLCLFLFVFNYEVSSSDFSSSSVIFLLPGVCCCFKNPFPHIVEYQCALDLPVLCSFPFQLAPRRKWRWENALSSFFAHTQQGNDIAPRILRNCCTKRGYATMCPIMIQCMKINGLSIIELHLHNSNCANKFLKISDYKKPIIFNLLHTMKNARRNHIE